MRVRRLLVTAVQLTLLSSVVSPSHALEAIAIKESAGTPGAMFSPACPLAPNRNGTCANYEWFNMCSGYIWIVDIGGDGAQAGVRFGGPENPCVQPGNRVKRAITYFRATIASYGCQTNIYLDADPNGDGCPDYIIAQDLGMEPGERWNCSNFNALIPAGVTSVIVRAEHSSPYRNCRQGRSPFFATDGPYTQVCDPLGQPRSFYYGIGGTACIPWRDLSPTGRNDNFLFWLVVDSAVSATEPTTWGSVKSIYR